MAQVYVKRFDSQRPACSMRYALALLGDLIGTTFLATLAASLLAFILSAYSTRTGEAFSGASPILCHGTIPVPTVKITVP